MWRPRGCSASANGLRPSGHFRAEGALAPLEIVFWLCTLLPFVVTPNYLSLASQIAITALFALSLDLILGYAGIVSLGHAAFFGVGAYTAGLLVEALLAASRLTGLVRRGSRRRASSATSRATSSCASGTSRSSCSRWASACCCTRRPTARARSPAAPTACRASRSAAARLQVRPVRPHRLRLLARGAVRLLPGCTTHHPLALRPRAARHPREPGCACRRSARRAARTCARSTPSRR